MRRISLSLAILLLFSAAMPVMAAEYPKEVIPGGHTVGLHLMADGLIVIGFSPVQTAEAAVSPGQSSGLRIGDRIAAVNAQPVETTAQLQLAVNAAQEDAVTLEILRDSQRLQLSVSPAVSSQSGERKLGLLLRDSMSGIGTVTFYDPASGLFGALGHGVNDVDTGALLPISRGEVFSSVVTDARVGQPGQPGELHGEFKMDSGGGVVTRNTNKGIFGILRDTALLGEAVPPPVPVAAPGEVRTGEVTILSNVSGTEIRAYTAEIVRLYGKAENCRNFMLEITDPELLKATGGIVQGMSGSPVLQDGKLVGAVTHVLISDPARGYGIFIETMLEEGWET